MAAGETAFVPRPLFSSRGDVISAPFPWLFTGEDNVRLVVVNSLVGAAVTLQGRFLGDQDKTPTDFSETRTPASDRTPSTFNFPLGVGSLLNCSLIATAGAPLIGQTYAMLQVIRGLGGATKVLGCLLAGYVTAMQHLAYPGSPIQSSIEGGGYIRAIAGTLPGAGGTIQETVPTGARWELRTIRHTLACAAGGPNRVLQCIVAQPGQFGVLTFQPTAQPPATTSACAWAPNLPIAADAANVVFEMPLPDAPVLLAGGTFTITAAGLQAGDQFSQPLYTVREWLEAA